ncbi:hypothetical protein AVEN_214482-1 [Araneus ventricosus]|uniref:Tc1-like transposase DDE domain-containing protein n=1 Tax=Araneus ventricosus TaxID=182803 RepID=A0A4Y2CUK7_ARAVE|nr:hypothetical protein AVEN_214482-1 [Araneus ventricosus]
MRGHSRPDRTYGQSDPLESGCPTSTACMCTILMQDGAPPHIANPIKRLIIGNDKIISRYILTNWPPRSPDVNPCDFWLWCYLKNVVFSGPIADLAELMIRIE